MTQKAALCQHLLDGGTVSVMTAFKLFGMTNASREIGRSIEREETGGFGVIVSRLSKPFKSRYGHVGVYFEYRLNQTRYNKEGIKKMRAYVKSQNKAC